MQCSGYIRAIYYHFYNIFASRCLKWFELSLKRQALQIEEYLEMLMLYSIGLSMSGPYLGHFRAIFGNFTISLLLDAENGSNFSLKCHARQPQEYFLK